jgi:type VI secretion system protein ImpJ
MTQLNTNPIQWHDGMLLMPQHFQQMDVRMENMMTYSMSHAFPFFWGVVNLKIDEALLTLGTFRPLELEVIMPDGLLITGLPESQTPLEVDLLPLQDKIEATPHFIYLCVPQQRKTEKEKAEPGALARYKSSSTNNIVDMNTGERAINIPCLVPNLSLHVGTEPPPHYITLPIAQVSYNTKSFDLTDYVPPLVQVYPLSTLGKICNQLAYRVRQKLGYLQEKVQSVSERVTKESFFEELEDVRLKLIVGLLPFEAVLFMGKATPFQLYLMLCNLAGSISGVKYGEVPPPFDPYDHLDIMKNYSQVIKYIEKILNEIEESYTVIPFTLNERVFTLQLQSSWVGDRLILGAREQPGMTTEDLLSWIKNCVIVTDKYITIAKDDRVLGASRELVAEVPSMNLVPTKGMKLFIVDVDPRYIHPRGVLCLFNFSDDDSTRPVEIVLYRSNPQNLEEKS